MAYLHSHEYYELYFQFTGKRSYFCNNKHYILDKNSFVTTKPNTLHKFESDEIFQRILISASAELFSPLQIEFLNNLDEKIITFPEEVMLQIRETLESLIDLHNSTAHDKQVQIILKLGLLFHQINVAKSKPVEAERTLEQNFTNYAMAPTVLKIMDYIQTNYNKPISLDDLCKLPRS